MATAAQINTKVDEAVTEIEAANWSKALRKLLAAKAMLSAQVDGREGDQSLTWDRSAIDALIKDVRKQAGSSAGIRSSKIRYERTSD